MAGHKQPDRHQFASNHRNECLQLTLATTDHTICTTGMYPWLTLLQWESPPLSERARKCKGRRRNQSFRLPRRWVLEPRRLVHSYQERFDHKSRAHSNGLVFYVFLFTTISKPSRPRNETFLKFTYQNSPLPTENNLINLCRNTYCCTIRKIVSTKSL